tara:strand:- start:4966 stop:5139 length:174 start_codon:yes stop_codon:yes gene_type:complete
MKINHKVTGNKKEKKENPIFAETDLNGWLDSKLNSNEGQKDVLRAIAKALRALKDKD